MADTLPNITLPVGGSWVDLYATSGIAVGTAISVQVVGGSSTEVHVATSAGAPTGAGYNVVRLDEEISNSAGESGAWARAGDSTLLNKRESKIQVGVV